MTDETAFAGLQNETDTELEMDKNAAPNDIASLEVPSVCESQEANKMTDETAFAGLHNEKDTEVEVDKNVTLNDIATLKVPCACERQEANMCEEKSQISEHMIISFEDEKNSVVCCDVAKIKNSSKNRIFLYILVTIIVVAVAIFVAVIVVVTGKNDLQDGPEVTTTSLPKKLTCTPGKQSANIGEDVVYACNLQNVQRINKVHVAGSQLSFETTLGGSQSGTFTSDSLTLTVDLEAENQITITLSTLACDMEGKVMVTVNGDISDTMTLRIISMAQTPQLSIPENIFKNQETTFNCSGNVGREENGSNIVTLGFEALMEGQNGSTSIPLGQAVTVLSNTSDNCENHVTIQLKVLASDVMNGLVLSCVSTVIANQSTLYVESSTPIAVMDSNIFFDKGLEYEIATGDVLSLTCSFQNTQNVNQLKITRDANREGVIALNRNGTVDNYVNHFTISSSDWGNNYGSVTISAIVKCSDENLYRCETDTYSGEAGVLITVLSRPETPSLTLSYELIVGQEPFANRLSECKAQIGDPAGNLVVEVLNGDEFQEHAVIYGTGYPLNMSLECGIEQTIQFYFSNLVNLNNTEIRCAVKPAEVFNDTEKVVSESQMIRTVDGSYCYGINSSFYVHPYDCHYFVDCNKNESGEFHFTKCDKSNSCPNPLGGCDIDSCAGVCPKDLNCSSTIEVELNDTVTMRCKLGNVETITLETVALLQDGSTVLNETWSSGTASVSDGSINMTYTAEEIFVNIPNVRCTHGAVYTILVNDLLSDNASVVIKTTAKTPVISSTRFVAGQMATLTCEGNIGNSQESKPVFVESWIKAGPYMQDDFGSMTPTSEVTEFNNTSCAYQKKVFLNVEVIEMINGTAEFRCRTATDSQNLTSEIVNVFVDPQEIDIQPPESKVAVGVTLTIQCTVTGVTDLTFIRFYRGNDSSHVVCQVTQGAISNRLSDIICMGEVNATGGRLKMNFASVQCDHEDTYVCECNPEASTQKRTSLYISRPIQNPAFTLVPLTLVENTALLEDENFTCEADLGYPSPSSHVLIIQTNRNGDYETYDDVFGVERTFLNENCSKFETITVNYHTFDSSWNNTQLRCAIAYHNGTVTTYISEEITVQLIPESYCEGREEFNVHPYDKHLYIRCTDTDLVVESCNDECSTVTNGTLVCQTCSSP